jgi:hypothetical protein
MNIAKRYRRGWPFVLLCVLILIDLHDAPKPGDSCMISGAR